MAEARAELSSARRLRFGWLDVALLVGGAAFVAFLAWRVQEVLNYRWQWASISNYLVRYDAARGWVPNLLLQGLGTTLRLSVWGMAVAVVLGLGVALCRTARLLLPRLVGGAYVEVLRNTPPLVLIFVGYFFVANQVMPLLGLRTALEGASPAVQDLVFVAFGEPRLVENFLSAVVVLGLFQSAYVAEIVRAGIRSVEPGQWDAARALGLRPWAVLRKVVLPQALVRMLPPLAGQFIALIKDSSVVSLISIQELTFMANDVAVSTTRVFETWITASVLYFGVCFGLSLAFRGLERRAG